MSAFCTKCHKTLGFPGEPDIDVEKIFKEKLVEDDTMINVGLCEGCTLIAVARIDNTLKVQYLDGDWTEYTREPSMDDTVGNTNPDE